MFKHVFRVGVGAANVVDGANVSFAAAVEHKLCHFKCVLLFLVAVLKHPVCKSLPALFAEPECHFKIQV